MKAYQDLTPKEKFVRTCIIVPISFAILIGIWAFCTAHFTLGTSWIVKFAVCTVIIAIVSVWQLITTYKAWKDDENNY